MSTNKSDFFSLKIKPWNTLKTAGIIACAATLFGFCGRISWFLDLFAHFRVQYLLGLGILAPILFITKRRKTAIVFFLFAFINFAVIIPLYFGGQKKPTESAPSYRVMMINVNTRLGDPNLVKKVIKKNNPDILVLEEISARWMPNLASLTNTHPHSLAQPRDDNFGIGIFSKMPFTDVRLVYIGSADVPSILATVQTKTEPLHIIATHLVPPAASKYSKARDEQMAHLHDYIHSPTNVLLLGDLNATPWSHPFRRLLKESGLKDSTRGFGIQPSWPSFNPLLRIPIDHCLHSPDISIIDRRIGEHVSSDHYPLIVDFQIKAETETFLTTDHTDNTDK